jgi:glycosyltransferase involved in cell wall biosynthesis
MRLAWFSPFPPVNSGIAGRSAELVERLRSRGHLIDPYPEQQAHDFPWRHRQAAYDLVVYQFGNSSHHDYEWPYALQYAGLTILHDTRLHHARAALLLRERRLNDYRAEFQWNHPGLPADAAEIAVAGFDSRLYSEWPMNRTLIEASRLVAVHGERARRELLEVLERSSSPPDTADRRPARSTAPWDDRVVSVRLGEGVAVSKEREREARVRVRDRYGIPADAILFGSFGGLTPEKRLTQILVAFRALLPHAPGARLLLAGAAAAHFEAVAAIAAHGLEDPVTLTGYVETEAALTEHIAACDISLNLRWPTARETSGPWLRALAAGKPTIITDLIHLGDVPSLDPRTWQQNGLWALGPGLWETETEASTSVTLGQKPKAKGPKPVCVAIDILDEDHSLRLAMRRLATDAELRAQLGRAAHDWWRREHSVDVMVDDYECVMREAAARPTPTGALPVHVRDAGDRRLRELLGPFGVEAGF